MTPSASPAAVATDVALRRELRAQRRRRTLSSLALLAPAIAFLLIAFILPLLAVLYNSISNGDASSRLPLTTRELAARNGSEPLDDAFYRTLATELEKAADAGQIAELARALNYRIPGFRSLLLRTAREVKAAPAADRTRSWFVSVDRRWEQPLYLEGIKALASPFTDYFLLAALDLRRDAHGLSVVSIDRRIYIDYLGRTLWMCAVVTLSCLLMGYPLAYLIASTTGRTTRVLLMLVMLSFWTSILVRTAAWVIVLRDDGLVNGFLQAAGLTSGPVHILYDRPAVCIVMVHVLLPFMILPIYSVMKGLPTNLMKAASSLGARPLAAFTQVYLPLTLPGMSAGVLFTYILALGFYIAPALVGGANDQMISSQIARFALGEAHWSMAASLAIVLLVSAGAIYTIFSRIAPIERSLPTG